MFHGDSYDEHTSELKEKVKPNSKIIEEVKRFVVGPRK